MRESFEEYVAVSSGRLHRFAYVLCGDRHLAEDLVQDVLSRAHRRWSRIEAEHPDTYLNAAIVRAHLSWRRRRASTEKVLAEPPESGTSSPDFAARLAARDELWALLSTLSRTQRAVLVLRYYEDLDDRRIAEVLGCAPATVRVHASRALGALRSSMSPVVTQPQGDPR
ncbi:MAG TPA: SigE family RNA polymerase sigma factor [Micromonosporaceae bacterium]|nr:SigE family RNA polymerase sigma factor [Micromonosporaceae bacterium]